MPIETSQPRPSCDVTFFIACFNEEVGIIPTVETVLAAANEAGRTFDIIVIDDASTDRSVELLQEFVARNPAAPITIKINPVNRGIGRNFVDAAFLGRGTYYRLVCGDNVDLKENHLRLLSHLGQADIILSYHENTGDRPFLRRALSRAYTLLVNLLSGQHIRYYNNLPVFLRQDVLRWHSDSSGFGFQADLVTRLLHLGATYVEVPTLSRERTGGKSKAISLRNFRSVGHTLLTILSRRIGGWFNPPRGDRLGRDRKIITSGFSGI